MAVKGSVTPLRVPHLQLVAVQVKELQAVHASGCELGRVLVHVHAHQPVADLLTGPLGHRSVLPLVILAGGDGILVQSLQETQVSLVKRAVVARRLDSV